MKSTVLTLSIAYILHVTTGLANQKFDVRADCDILINDTVRNTIAAYSDTVNDIITYITDGPYKGKTYQMLTTMTDTFGSRFSGSQGFADSSAWIFQVSNAEGLTVASETLEVPFWKRNNESLWMTSPRIEQMDVLALGKSIGTPEEGIEAEVLVVTSFEDLENNTLAMDRIVVFNQDYTDYGSTVQYRNRGASAASKEGAVAALIRSITPFSIANPHTGDQNYDDNIDPIPSASITTEDAKMLHRMQMKGEEIILHLTLGADADDSQTMTTWNTIIDLEGTESAEEFVVVSGHFDSWDVGTGAMDDGGGAMISWAATRVLKEMNLIPRRTHRTILWAAEELGILGAKEFLSVHDGDFDNYQLMMESDDGTFEPLGVNFSGNDTATCIMAEIVKLLLPLGTTILEFPAEVSDIGIFGAEGVPLAGIINENNDYFWYHHSPADRLEVQDSGMLDRCTALWTAVSYVAADMPFKLR